MNRRHQQFYMTRPPRKERLWTAARWVCYAVAGVCLGLALAGCAKRAQGEPAAQSVDGIYTDRDTGCQYFARLLSGNRYEPLTPRIAADGRSHLGCKSAGK